MSQHQSPSTDEPREVSFVVTATPVPQPRQRHGAVVRGDKAMSVNYTDSAHPIHAFKYAVKRSADEALQGPLEGPLHIGLSFVTPRPQSMNRKRGSNPRRPDTRKRGDIDNLAKAVLDALIGIAFADDSQVFSLYATKEVAALGETPHVLVLLQEVHNKESDDGESGQG